MGNDANLSKKFSLKQKIFLYFYRSKQYFFVHWVDLKNKFLKFIDSSLFCVFIFCIILFFIQKILISSDINLTQEQLCSFGLTVAGIIGASIAIIFSFSTFILQSTADLFSTQYLNKFIQDRKEKFIFWSLVALTIFSFFTPLLIKYNVIEVLVTVLFIAFLLIYFLYKELRQRINPETTLGKIKNDAINQLEKINKEMVKYAHIQNKIFEYDDSAKVLSVAIQYKSNSNWNTYILADIKYLYEIGLRLLSKNEINSFNLTLKYIHDIYLKHLYLRNGHIMRIPASFWGTYTFEDEGVTVCILEYIESISNRIIQEKRKENIYYLLNVYENLISNTQLLKYADKNIGSHGENPILSLILGYFFGLLNKLTQSKETDWIWESIKSLSRVSNILLRNDYNHFNYNQLVQAIDKATIACLADKNEEAFVKEIVGIYFNQIKISWDKYSHNGIFWQDLFKNLKKNTLVLSISGGINLSISELYINFHEWQANVINAIFDLKDQEKQEKLKNAYIELMERWSDFLLDLARDTGLENKHVGLPIIQSIQNNLRIIEGLRYKFDLDLSKLYETQFNTLSWYFKKTEKVDSSLLFNLEQIQETLLREIDYNFNNKIFDNKPIIDLYIELTQQHFEKTSVGHGYNHPRIIEKLVCLGLILTKHNHDTGEVIKLINELNKKYLTLNKDYFDLRIKHPGLMGPNEHQLCGEIFNLENDLFSHNRGVRMGIKEFLSCEITKEIWDSFVGKIEYCKGIKYTTVSYF